jgi:hypothetical protein
MAFAVAALHNSIMFPGTFRQVLLTVLAVWALLAQLSLLSVASLSQPNTVNTINGAVDHNTEVQMNQHDGMDKRWSDLYAEMNRGEKRWWIEKHSKENLEKELWKINIEKYMGTQDQLDVYTAYGMGSVLEMEDPKGGRDAVCFKSWYEAWQTQIPFSEEPFFDWLDYGSGRHIVVMNNPACARDDPRRYYQMPDSQVKEVVVTVQVRSDGTTALVSRLGVAIPEGNWLFIWAPDERIYLIQDGYIHMNGLVYKSGHCSANGGGPVLHAGEFKIGKEGTIVWVNCESGHYKALVKHVKRFYQWLALQGVTKDSFVWRTPPQPYVPYSQVEWDAIFQ